MTRDRFNLSECADLLGVTPKTVTTWITKADLDTTQSEEDRRSKTLTLGQLKEIAEKHGRLLHLYQRLAGMSQQETDQESQSGEVSHPHDQALQQAIVFVTSITPSAPNYDNELLIITQRGDTTSFELRHAWQHALRDAMRRDWHVTHLIRRIDQAVVRDIIHTVDAPPKYRLLYLPSDQTTLNAHHMREQKDYIVAPGFGILEMGESKIVMWEQGKTQERILASLFQGWKRQAKDALTAFSMEEFSDALARVEGEGGAHGLVMRSLSDLTLPHTLLEARMRYVEKNAPELLQQAHHLVTANEQRQSAFRHQVQRNTFRQIITKRTLVDYIRTGAQLHDAYRALGCPSFEPQQVKEHLVHVVDVLREYPNYQLGILDEGTGGNATVVSFPAFWLVKEGNTVLLETHHAESEQANLEIKEPEIARGFFSYFNDIWSSLPADGKEKESVIEYLNLLIQALEHEIRGAPTMERKNPRK